MQNHCFHCPEPLQKWDKISSKKYSATRHSPNRQFSVQGDPGWHHEPKRVPKGTPKSSPQGGQLTVKINDFGGPPPSPSPRAPKPRFQKIFWSILNHFWAFRIHFYRLVSVLSAPAPAMIRNDSITVWRTSIPWRNRPWATISKPKKHKANSNPKRIKILPRKLTVFWNVPILCRMLGLWEYQEIFGMLRFASECQNWT